MSDKIKDNRCQVVFVCGHIQLFKCRYFSGNDDICEYRDGTYRCQSPVANVNKMTDLLKKMEEE